MTIIGTHIGVGEQYANNRLFCFWGDLRVFEIAFPEAQGKRGGRKKEDSVSTMEIHRFLHMHLPNQPIIKEIWKSSFLSFEGNIFFAKQPNPINIMESYLAKKLDL